MGEKLGLLAAAVLVGLFVGTPLQAQIVNGLPVGTATATATGVPTGTATATATATGVPTGTATATATGTPAGTATATITPTVPVGSTATSTVTPTIPSVATSTSTATITVTPVPAVASIIVGSATGQAGTSVSVDVSLETEADVAGTQNDITFDPKAPIAAKTNGRPDCTANPDINKGGTSFAFQPAGCTPGTDCTAVRALVLALDNVCPICGTASEDCPDVEPCPAVLYTCVVNIAEDAEGTLPLTCSNSGSSDPGGGALGTDCTDGSITIGSAEGATITIGQAVGAPSEFKPFETTFDTGVPVASVEHDLGFDPEAPIAVTGQGLPLCAVNPEIDKDDSTFAFTPEDCGPGEPDNNCSGIHVFIKSDSNTSAIPSGVPLYTCTVSITVNAPDGNYPLTCSNAVATGPTGNSVVTTCIDGSVLVGVQPTETPTAANTATPTPTSTPGTQPPATITNTPGPTATPFRYKDSSSCNVVAGSQSQTGWVLLLPAIVLLALRRRRR